MESKKKSSVECVEENSVGKPDDCGDEDKEVLSVRLPTVVIRPYRRTGGILSVCQYFFLILTLYNMYLCVLPC